MDNQMTVMQPAPMPPPYPMMARPEYEFDAEQNRVIGRLGGSLRFVGIIDIIFGALMTLAGIILIKRVEGVTALFQGVIGVLVGGWLFAGGGALANVVNTQGQDITNLMVAMRKLRNVYVLQAILVGLAIAVFVAAFIYGAATAHHAS